MEMTLRWYGEGNDSVTLEQIRQIPGVTGVITALHDIPAGEPWTYEDVMKRKQEVEAKGLHLTGIESINVHEDIKIGLPSRDQLIENYKKSLEAVGKAGIHLVCYNFMPVFDWTRTQLDHMIPLSSMESMPVRCLTASKKPAEVSLCPAGNQTVRQRSWSFLKNIKM